MNGNVEVLNEMDKLRQLLRQAWKLQRRAPEDAISKLEFIIRRCKQVNKDVVLASKCLFLLGKIYTEHTVDFEKGKLCLLQACLIEETKDGYVFSDNVFSCSECEVMGWLYHLSRTLYYNFEYKQSWDIIQYSLGSIFPSLEEIWGEQKIPSKVWSSGVNKYHFAIVLHALVLSVVFCPKYSGKLAQFVESWIDEHRAELWGQFNAETRFATLVLKLVNAEVFPLQDVHLNSSPYHIIRESNRVSDTISEKVSCISLDDDIIQVNENIDIYVLGESHILPMSWNKIVMTHLRQNISISMIPRLIIGLKAWHFNPLLTNSREHGILLTHMNSIPYGSTVLVCAGEIDLRQDATIAGFSKKNVQHLKYISCTEAISATVDAFFSGLRKFRDERKLKTILIHPVRPIPMSQASKKIPSIVNFNVEQWNDSILIACSKIENKGIKFLEKLYHKLCDPNTIKDSKKINKKINEYGCAASLHRLLPIFDIGDGVHLNRKVVPLVGESIWHLLKQNRD